jgi:transcriptional regulator of acetoin/glycerol metabolism
MPTIQIKLTQEQFDHIVKLAEAVDEKTKYADVIRAMIDLDMRVKPLPLIKSKEKDLLIKSLNESNGNISQTARNLGMHRRTLQRKLKRYGI